MKIEGLDEWGGCQENGFEATGRPVWQGTWKLVIVAISAAAMAVMTPLHVFNAVSVLWRFNFCHPFFTVSCASLLAMYGVSDALAFAKFLAEALGALGAEEIAARGFYIVENFIHPIMILCLLERLCATIFASTYENTRCWSIFLPTLFLCFVIGIVRYMTYKSQTAVAISIFLAVVCISLLVVLIVVNRRLIVTSKAKFNLTTRYQLVENVKTLRIFVPFVLLYNGINELYLVTNITLGVDYFYDDDDCQKAPIRYVVIYSTCSLLSMASEVLIAAWIFLRLQQSARKSREYQLQNRTAPIQRPPQQGQKTSSKIKNVLGVEMSTRHDQESHFRHLRQHWSK